MKAQISLDGIHWTDINNEVSSHVIYNTTGVTGVLIEGFSIEKTKSISITGDFNWHGFGRSIFDGINRGLKPSSHRHIMQRKIRKMVS